MSIVVVDSGSPDGTPDMSRATDLGDDEPGEVDAVNGAFMLCKAEAVREVGFHRGMARFYRRFDAPGHNPLVNAAVFLGIGAKLVTSLAITAVRGRRSVDPPCRYKRQDPPKRVESGEAGNYPRERLIPAS
jgi:hypothetical protein